MDSTVATEGTEGTELHGEKQRTRTDLIYRELSGAILGAFYSVHSELGFGFLEAVYSNALTLVLRGAGVRVDRQVPFEIRFRGSTIGLYRADLVVESSIILEVKSVQAIVDEHTAQLLNYLRAYGLRLGLLLNFGERAQFRRLIR